MSSTVATAQVALAELRRNRAEFERICAKKRARVQRRRREEREAIEATIQLVRAFPIEAINTLVASEGNDMREEMLTAVNYTVSGTRPATRITLGQVLQRIHDFAKENDDVNDMTVHVMALFSIMFFISERFHIDNTLVDSEEMLAKRLKYLSTFKQYGSDSNREDHSRIMRIREDYEPEEEERNYGPVAQALLTGTSKVESFFGKLYNAADQFTKAINPQLANKNNNETSEPAPVPISRTTMFLDPIVIQHLDRSVHLSILSFLFPRGLHTLKDKNLFIQGRIISLLYTNELDKYLDMRSMCIGLYKHLNRILNKFFWQPPAPPTFMNQRYIGNYEGYRANMNEWKEIINTHARLYSLGPGNSSLRREYQSPVVKSMIDDLLRLLRSHEENTKEYVPYEKWAWGTKAFFWVTSLSQLAQKVTDEVQKIENGVRQREAMMAHVEAERVQRANGSQAFDPNYVASRHPNRQRLVPYQNWNAYRRASVLQNQRQQELEHQQYLEGLQQAERERLQRAEEAQAFDPNYVAEVEAQKAENRGKAGPEWVPEGERQWMNNTAARAAEAERVTNRSAEAQYREDQLAEVIRDFNANVDRYFDIWEREQVLDTDASRAIQSADSDLQSQCNAGYKKGQAQDLPQACGAGNPLFEGFLGYKSAQTLSKERKDARQKFVDEKLEDAHGKFQEAETAMEQASAGLRKLLSAAQEITDFNNMGRGDFNRELQNVRTLLDTAESKADVAASAVVKSENVNTNVRHLPLLPSARTNAQVEEALNMIPSELTRRQDRVEADAIQLLQTQDFIKGSREFIENTLLFVNCAVAVGGGFGNRGPTAPRDSEPQQVNPDANYVTSVMPGAEVDPDIIIANVGTAPHTLKQTNARGEVSYVVVKGKNLGKVHQANEFRGMQPGEAPRQRMHPDAATIDAGREFAGKIGESKGIPSTPENLYRHVNRFHPGIKPTGHPLEAQRFLHFVPGYTGGIDYRTLDAYNVVGIDSGMGLGGAGGFVPARKGGSSKQTRTHRKHKQKTRKQHGGVVLSTEDLIRKVSEINTYNDINIMRFYVKTLADGLNALRTIASQSKNECMRI
jgi:hypothetical protein